MSAAADLFDAARALKRELTGNPNIGLDQEQDVDAFNAIISRWKPVVKTSPPVIDLTAGTKNPTALTNAAEFFAVVREAFGALSEEQVKGFERLLQAYGVAVWPIAYAAYGLATGWRETAKQMKPVKEAYWLSEDWRKNNLKYYPWYGRGDVQLTWRTNYLRADKELGLCGSLAANPELALRPDISAKVMVMGMEEGWFVPGHSLPIHLPGSGNASFDQYKQARRIINGTDAWEEIATNALKFEAALIAGGWR